MVGAWSSIQHMEESITLEELYAYMAAGQRAEHRRNKFAAALKGVNIDEHAQEDSDFERTKRKAAADLSGKSEEEYVFDLIGIEFEDDDD